jgi:hypothetical protein
MNFELMLTTLLGVFIGAAIWDLVKYVYNKVILPRITKDTCTCTTEDTSYYVNKSKGDDGNDGLSTMFPKKTLQSAFDDIPFHIKHKVSINIEDDVPPEFLSIIAGYAAILRMSHRDCGIIVNSDGYMSNEIEELLIEYSNVIEQPLEKFTSSFYHWLTGSGKKTHVCGVISQEPDGSIVLRPSELPKDPWAQGNEQCLKKATELK